MSRKEDKKLAEAARALADQHIAALIESPPLERRKVPGWDDFERESRAMGSKVVDELRRIACKQTGMTLEQLLEAERNTSWPREVVPVTPSPRMIARRRMKDAGVEELFIQRVADQEPIACDALKQVQAFLQTPAAFLVLSGAKGTRKTGSACWALGQVDGGAFVDVQDVVEWSIEKHPQWKRALKAPLVVFDDLGTERRRTDGEIAQFYDAFYRLFNGVYNGRRRLIITCNLTTSQFSAEPESGGYGPRLYDRLKEFGMWVDVAGDSVRAQPHWTDREPGEDDE